MRRPAKGRVESACERSCRKGIGDEVGTAELQIAAETSGFTLREVTISARSQPLLESELTGKIIRLFYRVYNRLGYGLLESVYRKALAIELKKAGIPFVQEASVEAWYEGINVGHFRVDFLVSDRVIVEVKAREHLTEADRDQLLNYLSCSKLEVGILLHFGPKARFERKVHSNSRKRDLPRE